MNTPDGLSMGKNMLWNSIGSLVYLGCNWLTTVLVVVLYPTYEASGCLASAMAVGNVVATIVLFKVRPFQVSDIKKDFSSSDYIALRIACSVAGIAFGFLYSLATVSHGAFEAAICYSLFKVVDSFVDVFYGIDQCHDRLDLAGISQMIRGVLALASFAGVSIYCNDLVMAIIAMALTTLLVVIFFDIPASHRLEAFHLKIDVHAVFRLIISCFPGFISSIIATLVVSLSRQLFGVEYGNEQLGIYAAIATPAVIVQAMAGYLYAPILGPISISYLNHKYGAVRRTIVGFFAALSIATALISVAFILVAAPLFNLVFGPTIAGYSYLTGPILLSTGLTAAELFLIDLLIAFRKKRLALLTCLPALAESLLLISPLSEVFGMNGISITICIAYASSIAITLPILWHATKEQ